MFVIGPNPHGCFNIGPRIIRSHALPSSNPPRIFGWTGAWSHLIWGMTSPAKLILSFAHMCRWWSSITIVANDARCGETSCSLFTMRCNERLAQDYAKPSHFSIPSSHSHRSISITMTLSSLTMALSRQNIRPVFDGLCSLPLRSRTSHLIWLAKYLLWTFLLLHIAENILMTRIYLQTSHRITLGVIEYFTY